MIRTIKTFIERENISYLLKQPNNNACQCGCFIEQDITDSGCKENNKYFKTNLSRNIPGQAKNNIPTVNLFKYPGKVPGNLFRNAVVINNIMRDDGSGEFDTLERTWVCNGTTYAYKIDKYVSSNNGSYILAISSTVRPDGTPYYAFMGVNEYTSSINNIGSVPEGLKDAFLTALAYGGPNNNDNFSIHVIPNNTWDIDSSHRNPNNVPILDPLIYAIPKTMGYSGPLIVGPFINDNSISTTSDINHVVNKFNYWLSHHSPYTPLIECIPYPTYYYQPPPSGGDEAWWLHKFGAGYEHIFIEIEWTPGCPTCPPHYTEGTLYIENSL